MSETDAALAPDTAPEAPPQAPERPMLFLHIPKTAGTSLLPAMRNRFGDARVLCLNDADPKLQDTIDQIVVDRLDTLSCLAGQVPVHYFAPHLERFRPFTVLRQPIARVFSLFRFLGDASDADLKTMKLERGFGFEEFIGSRAPGVFSMVNNAMCRMLCGDPRLSDPASTEFWRIDPDPALVERAMATLEQFDFGLVEEMAATRQLLHARLNLPYGLGELVENTPGDSEEKIAHLQMVIRRNMLDLALYERAATLFHARVHAIDGGIGVAGEAVLSPVLNRTIKVADIPGRQGFGTVENAEVSWLRADRPARIYFRAPAGVARIVLKFYCIIGDYPTEKIVVSVNGERVAQSTQWGEPRWFTLEAKPSRLTAEVNELAIDPPIFLSVRQQTPDTQGQRYRSVALANIAFCG